MKIKEAISSHPEFIPLGVAVGSLINSLIEFKHSDNILNPYSYVCIYFGGLFILISGIVKDTHDIRNRNKNNTR